MNNQPNNNPNMGNNSNQVVPEYQLPTSATEPQYPPMGNTQPQGTFVAISTQALGTGPQFQAETANQPQYQGVPIVQGQPLVYTQGVNGTPPQAMYIAQPVQPQPVAVAAPIRFGGNSVMIHCPYCNKDGPTIVDHEIGPLLLIISIVLCLFFVWCAILLCCIPGLQKPVHKCSSCGRVVGYGEECYSD